MVLSIEERVFLVEYVYREGNRYIYLVQEQFPENFPETPVPHRNAFRKLIEKFRVTGSVLDAERCGRQSKLNDKKLMDVSDSMLFRDRPRTLVELKTAIPGYIRNISQADLQKMFVNKIIRVYTRVLAHGHYFQQLL
jgi:hypothetical protein